MKKFGIILMILLLCASLPLVKTNAQKVSKIEKLLEYLVDNDTVKFQKNRAKLDNETQLYYPDEVALIDYINEIWNVKKVDSIPHYFSTYKAAMAYSFPAICGRAKVDVEQLRMLTDDRLVALLSVSTDRLALTRTVLDSVASTQYPMNKAKLAAIQDIREEAMYDVVKANPQATQCELYLKEYPQGRFLLQVMNVYDDGLFRTVSKTPSIEAFKLYFDNTTVNGFFGRPENRRSMTQARSLYDDFLYQLTLQPQELATLKSAIDTYRTDARLTAADRKHSASLEYRTDSVDYEVLKSAVTGADQLALVKNYLLTHRYKEFRDKAVGLRATFEEHVIWQAPAYTYAYSKGKLVKSTETGADKTTTNNYTYNEKGALKQVDSSVLTGTDEALFTTTYTFDANGRCTLESRVDTKAGSEVYRRASVFAPTGELLSDSLRTADGQLLLRRYDAQARVTEQQEYTGGKLVTSVNYQYDDRGELEKTLSSFAMPETLQPTYVIGQTETCEYDAYGYLRQQVIEKTLANSTKTQSVLTYLYDEFGNPIDSNAYYEYDHTGRWVKKTDRNNPSQVEVVQCIYK